MSDALHAMRLECLVLLGPAAMLSALLLYSEQSYNWLRMITTVIGVVGLLYLGWERFVADPRASDLLVNLLALVMSIVVAGEAVTAFKVPDPSELLATLGNHNIVLLGCMRPICTRPWPLVLPNVLVVLVAAWVVCSHGAAWGTREGLLTGAVPCLRKLLFPALLVALAQARLAYHGRRQQAQMRPLHAVPAAEVLGAASDAESQSSSSSGWWAPQLSDAESQRSSASGWSIPRLSGLDFSLAGLRSAVLGQRSDRRAAKQDLRSLYLLCRHLDGSQGKQQLPACAALRVADFLGARRYRDSEAAQAHGADDSGNSSSDDSVGHVWQQLHRAFERLY